MKVDADRANYFREQPLHHSQKETKYEIDHSIFTYKLRPNNDFYQALLQHGTHVEVLSPPKVREDFAKTVREIAEKYAKKHNIDLTEYLPEYVKYGRAAPMVRNRLIVDSSDIVVALWDQSSRGTEYVINYANASHKPVTVYLIKPDK